MLTEITQINNKLSNKNERLNLLLDESIVAQDDIKPLLKENAKLKEELKSFNLISSNSISQSDCVTSVTGFSKIVKNSCQPPAYQKMAEKCLKEKSVGLSE